MTKWKTIEHIGFEGRKKDTNNQTWNATYGDGNWRRSWELTNGANLDFNGVFEQYIESYSTHFSSRPKLANWLQETANYTYDKDLVDKETAFNPFGQVNKPNTPNQFHHVALNIALEERLDKPFQGTKPLQVREGKPGIPKSSWPTGWFLSPGRIPCVDPSLIPQIEVQNPWWEPGSIEDLYQRAKVLQIKV